MRLLIPLPFPCFLVHHTLPPSPPLSPRLFFPSFVLPTRVLPPVVLLFTLLSVSCFLVSPVAAYPVCKNPPSAAVAFFSFSNRSFVGRSLGMWQQAVGLLFLFSLCCCCFVFRVCPFVGLSSRLPCRLPAFSPPCDCGCFSSFFVLFFCVWFLLFP